MNELLRRASHLDVATLAAIRRDAILVLAGRLLGDRRAREWADSSGDERVQSAVDQHTVWIAELEGVAVGWIEIDQDRVEGLYVRSGFARRGIGSRLLARAESSIRDSGHASAALDASPNAEEFYLRRGYVPQSEAGADGARPMRKVLDACLACDLIARPESLPGGRIHQTAGWSVEHCVGALGVGTLIVKPLRHCLHLADLTRQEAQELGPLLRQAAACAGRLTGADQTYVCLWSHAGWTSVHIHFVVQPVRNSDRERFSSPGPSLQAAMFARGEQPPRDEVVAFCDRAREFFRTLDDGAVEPTSGPAPSVGSADSSS